MKKSAWCDIALFLLIANAIVCLLLLFSTVIAKCDVLQKENDILISRIESMTTDYASLLTKERATERENAEMRAEVNYLIDYILTIGE